MDKPSSGMAEIPALPEAATLHIPSTALMVIDLKSKLPTRVRRIRRTDGTTVRIAVRSGEELPASAKAEA